MTSSNPFQTSYNYNHNPRQANRVVLTSFGNGGPAHIAERHSYQNQYMPQYNHYNQQQQQQQYAPPLGPPPPLSRNHASYSGEQLTTSCCCCAHPVQYIRSWSEYECSVCGITGPVPGPSGSTTIGVPGQSSSKLRKSPARRPSGGGGVGAPSSMYAPPNAPPPMLASPPPLPPRSRPELDTMGSPSQSKIKDKHGVRPLSRSPLTARDVEDLASMFSQSSPVDPPLQLLATLFLDEDEAQSPSPSPTPSSPSSPVASSPRNPFRRMSGNLSVPERQEGNAAASSSKASPSTNPSRNPFRRASYGFNSPNAASPANGVPSTLSDRLAALALTRAAEHDAYTADALLTRAIQHAFGSLDILGKSFRNSASDGEVTMLLETLNTFYGLVKRQRAHLDVLRSCIDNLLDRPGKDLQEDPAARWAPILLEVSAGRRVSAVTVPESMSYSAHYFEGSIHRITGREPNCWED